MPYTSSQIHSLIKWSCAKGDPYAEVTNIQHKLATLRNSLKSTRDIAEKIVIKNRIHDLEYCLTMQKSKDIGSSCRVVITTRKNGKSTKRNKGKKVAVGNKKNAVRKQLDHRKQSIRSKSGHRAAIGSNQTAEAWVRKLFAL